jgi:hypothetical protein
MSTIRCPFCPETFTNKLKKDSIKDCLAHARKEHPVR